MIGRRELITLVGGAAAWPLPVRAQQPTTRPVIGFLGATTPELQSKWTTAFVQRLGELGWTDGRTVHIDLRWAHGQRERTAAALAEFVKRNVDIIVTHGSEDILAARRATSEIPIVFPVSSDPLGAGLVASLSRPGGNVTGISLQRTDTAAKRLQLLLEVVPGVRRLAILANVANPSIVLELEAIGQAAREVGLEIMRMELRRQEDIGPAFDAMKGGADAVYVAAEPLVFVNRLRIATLALGARLPTIFAVREYLEAGGLMSYGPNFPDLFRRSAEIVDKILRGAKPADIPVEQPIKFDFAINLTTAKALGLSIPELYLARADEVIE